MPLGVMGRSISFVVPATQMFPSGSKRTAEAPTPGSERHLARKELMHELVPLIELPPKAAAKTASPADESRTILSGLTVPVEIDWYAPEVVNPGAVVAKPAITGDPTPSTASAVGCMAPIRTGQAIEPSPP